VGVAFDVHDIPELVVSLRLSSGEAREFAEALMREADAADMADMADPDHRPAIDR
jgi:hypothetical protein